MKRHPDCRASVIATLHILSSPERQLSYEGRVPDVKVPDELVSMWFDDSYLPESRAFKESFSVAELNAMSEFNDFFDERVDHLPGTASGVAGWLRDENWREIVRRAGVLNDLLRSESVSD